MSEFATKCVHGGYSPESGEPGALPIVQSTTFKYDSVDQLGDLFDLKASGFFYTRLANPTLVAVENKINELEGGVGALVTASGQSATMMAITNICDSGDHIISAAQIYGGTFNLFDVTLRKLGIETSFVTVDATEEEIKALIKPNTKLIFGETLTNPTLEILDLEKFAKIAHENNIPLIVDNTFPTPYLCRPFEFGADIVVHSTSKYLDGHAVALGGVIVDSGNFDWSKSNKFDCLNVPDESYHGLIYTKSFGKAAYITKARTHLMRDMGAQMSPQNAFLLNMNIQTLPLRMKQHVNNARAVVKALLESDKIAWVNHPEVEGNKYNELAKKYLPSGTCGVVSFGVKGGFDSAKKFLENLKLASLEIHVADIKTCCLHPASTTHRQMSSEKMKNANISEDLIRFSVGIEDEKDIVKDILQALEKI